MQIHIACHSCSEPHVGVPDIARSSQHTTAIAPLQDKENCRQNLGNSSYGAPSLSSFHSRKHEVHAYILQSGGPQTKTRKYFAKIKHARSVACMERTITCKQQPAVQTTTQQEASHNLTTNDMPLTVHAHSRKMRLVVTGGHLRGQRLRGHPRAEPC